MVSIGSVYPESAAERDAWVVGKRGARAVVDAEIPYAFLVEEERFAGGDVGDVATIFLTNRECPWRCAMCDLWQHTLTSVGPRGSIPKQIEYALERLPKARQVKLYNSGSFFDSGAIPVEEYGVIAGLVGGFERVIVESHPSLVGTRALQLEGMLGGGLEVAMGLETAHAEVLEKLNKRMTLGQYRAAAEWLRAAGIALRSFVLVQPPFMKVEESLEWACRSVEFAFECGATAVSLLPTRAGNGAVDALAKVGAFTAPSLRVVEEAFEFGLRLAKGRVFVDLWEIGRVTCCAKCKGERVDRLARMNLSQAVEAGVGCGACGGVA